MYFIVERLRTSSFDAYAALRQQITQLLYDMHRPQQMIPCQLFFIPKLATSVRITVWILPPMSLLFAVLGLELQFEISFFYFPNHLLDYEWKSRKTHSKSKGKDLS